MRKLLIGAVILVFGAGVWSKAAAQVINLRGANEPLLAITREVTRDCGLNSVFNPVGGGSSSGEVAMVTYSEPFGNALRSQNIAPMSRELAGTYPSFFDTELLQQDWGSFCSPTAEQLLIGLDGIPVLGANQVNGSSLGADSRPACRDTITGGQGVTVAGCSAADGCVDNGNGTGTYTFTDWRDVLGMIYGGQNHTPAAQLLADKRRNPARINCASPVRQALVDNWGAIFSQASGAVTCRTTTCLKLKHAFRAGDTSDTTELLAVFLGLIPIPQFTSQQGQNFPKKDPLTATAHPFCNAGEATMNKGDADYLDLDPIRRIADSEAVQPDNRAGLEQVAEGYGVPSNPPPVPGNDVRPDPVPGSPTDITPGLADFGAPNRQNVGPDPNNPTWTASQQAELPKRKGLGVVLPIVVPGTFLMFNTTSAYWRPDFVVSDGPPVLCTPGVYAPTLPDTAPPGVCPNGFPNGLCNLPVNNSNLANPNFNCMSVGAKPTSPPIIDLRVYNLLVLTSGGKYVYDDFNNPLLSLSQTRQRRVVSAFFRLHATRTTNYGGAVTGGPCREPFSPTNAFGPGMDWSSSQIGCLVKANACSIGVARLSAVDDATNMAFQIGGSFPPSRDRITALATGSALAYPMATRLWVNTVNSSNVTGNESLLLDCFGRNGDTSIIDSDAAHYVVPVPAGVSRNKTCPATFP